MRFHIFLFVFWGAGFLFSIHAQESRSELERQKETSLIKIRRAQRILAQTKYEKEANLGQLRALQEQIRAQQKLVDVYSRQLNNIGQDIGEIHQVISAMESDLGSLRKEYAGLIYWSYKHSSSMEVLCFLFAAESFKQFFLRMEHVAQVKKLRKLQLEEIQKVQNVLFSQYKSLKNKREKQKRVLSSQKRQKNELLRLQGVQKRILKRLTRKESSLLRQLRKKERSLRKLNQLIKETIRKELQEGRMKVSHLSQAFLRKKKKLPWPISNAFVSSKFGKQRHPVLKRIQVDNQGINLQAQKKELVKAVFEGHVTTIAYVPGMGNVIILRHGNYYTLYARLSRVFVKKGHVVVSEQPIGTPYTDPKGITEMHFQVWKESTKMNPEDWLAAK
ncbi:MAG: peptidoglycan DD-metalloendopeptidase family protein [Cytophagales bacterium]|nr:peptidoglycan DD-metalloendopeptidase family protein [Cytophagales bacterium]